MSAATTHTITVNLGPRSYDVLVGAGLLDTAGTHAAKKFPALQKIAVITETTVGPLYAERVLKSLEAAGLAPVLITVPAGEASKSMGVAQTVCSEMARAGLDRKSVVVALGGGVIGDLAGYCAAIYQRGVPYIQMPTTVLSQVDSSVGGKTGVNLAEAKNMVGCFHQPALVLADTSTLVSLPPREKNEGFAEIIKHAAIRDAMMMEAIGEQADGRGNLATLIARNIAIKARIVEADEHETKGLRALLNFGHTIGHAIENAAGYGQLLHGEAISLGLIAAARVSVKLSGLPDADARRIEDLLKSFALPTTLPASMSEAEILEAMRHDKKFEHGSIRFVLLRALGDAFVSADVTLEDCAEAVAGLRS